MYSNIFSWNVLAERYQNSLSAESKIKKKMRVITLAELLVIMYFVDSLSSLSTPQKKNRQGDLVMNCTFISMF